MDRMLAIKTINRCEELGVFDMRCLNLEFESEADKLKTLVDLLMSVDTAKFKPEVKKLIFMDDETFKLMKIPAKFYIKKFDRDQLRKQERITVTKDTLTQIIRR